MDSEIYLLDPDDICCSWQDQQWNTKNSNGQIDDRTGFSWSYQILPYIEQENLFRLVSRSELYATPVEKVEMTDQFKKEQEKAQQKVDADEEEMQQQ